MMPGFNNDRGEYPPTTEAPGVPEILDFDEVRPPVMDRRAVDGKFVPPLDDLERTQFLQSLGRRVTNALSEKPGIEGDGIDS